MTTRTARKTLAPDISQFLPDVHVKHAPRIVPRKRKERKHPPVGETARDRFIRIGGQRMKNVLRDLRLIGNLASANYDVNPRDVKVMQEAISVAFDQSFSRFSNKAEPHRLEDTFVLKKA